MNFYDVLAAEKWSGGIPTTNFFDLLFAQSISGEQWQVYEGTLPATINANGDNLRQYQIHGNTGGVGDDSGTAGYVIPMNVRSLNIYDFAETSWSADGTILNDSGEPISLEGSHYTTNFIPVEPGEVYYLAGSLANETRWRVYFYDSDKSWIRRTGSKSPRSTRVIAMDENASYFQLQVGTDIVSTSDWNFVHSRTAPEKYQPYFNTTTPIYISDDPLEADEYVDYATGKIYRRTVNEFDKDNAAVYNAYIDYNYSKWIKIESGAKTVKIPCLPQTQYTLSVPSELSVFRIAESANSDIEPTTGSGSAISIITKNDNSKYTFTTAQNTQCLIFQGNGALLDEWFNGLMLAKGDTAPETYTPYLQPTDPPVPLPALPTCEGTTVIDYAGQSVAPEKVVLEYKKGI